MTGTMIKSISTSDSKMRLRCCTATSPDGDRTVVPHPARMPERSRTANARSLFGKRRRGGARLLAGFPAGRGARLSLIDPWCIRLNWGTSALPVCFRSVSRPAGRLDGPVLGLMCQKAVSARWINHGARVLCPRVSMRRYCWALTRDASLWALTRRVYMLYLPGKPGASSLLALGQGGSEAASMSVNPGMPTSTPLERDARLVSTDHRVEADEI